MKRTTVIAVLCALCCTSFTRISAAAIGTWNIYSTYNEIKNIEPAGNIVYVLSSDNLFSYNVNDQSIYAYNKVNSLNDNNISHIKWNKNVNRLIIIYSNYNIDLLDNNGKVTNMSDYYSKLTTYDKTVNNITVNGIYAYLSTNFGIIKINMRDSEISETYNLGMVISNCAISDNRIYVLTGQDIYSASIDDNLLDKNNWSKENEKNNSIFDSENTIETTSKHGYKELRIYDNNNKCWWSNQEDNKLQSYIETEDGQQTITRRDINPDGPKHNHFGFIKCYDGKLYSCGSYIWDLHYDATIQMLDNGVWNIFQSDGIKEQTGRRFEDMMCLDIDPTDPKHVAGGCRNGVYEFYDGQFIKFHNSESTNNLICSTLSSGSKEYELITSICFDGNGNLWCFNGQSNPQKPLLKMDKEGNWTAFGDTDMPKTEFVRGMMIDSKGYMWFTNNTYNSQAVYKYDTNNNILYAYKNFANQDNVHTEATMVSCIAEDLDGNMWVGTNKGLLMLDEEQINDPTKGYTQIKIPRNDGTNDADYLLSSIGISGIAIDGANRKWIGTETNGVYLISSDNMEQLEHFQSENSNLISDNIESLAINNTTGEVFIGTNVGLCSYMSDAVAANEDMNKDNVYAYPNPVTPGYEGLITVVGLSFNADVKILTANGVVVAEGTSNGGMFTWDGKNKNGERVASGVYMVATAKSDGSKGTVCKIAIVR